MKPLALPRMLLLAACTAAALAPAVLSPALSALPAPPAPASGSGPTLAREDTMSTEVAEVLVTAPRVTLDEIIARVARGEARRESLLVDQTFRLTLRVFTNTLSAEPQLLQENVSQVYRKKPNLVRVVPLREWKRKPKDDRRGDIQVSSSMGEEVVNFAFRPEGRRAFRYRIEGRDLVGGHLIYRIGFEPRSRLDPSTPSGLVWIDTNDFVIVRQEVRFERSPAPILIKGIDKLVVERQNAGGFWVLKRVLMRAEMTIPIPHFGRAFDIALTYDDQRLNTGLSDSLFTAGRSARGTAVQVDSK